MATLTWNPALSIGIPEVDAQHQALFEAFQRLHEAIRAGHGSTEVEATMTFLQGYAERHFSDEEALMRIWSFPGRDRHALLHADFAQRIELLANRLEEGAPMMSLTLLHVLREWLADHIQVEDMTLGAWIRSQRP